MTLLAACSCPALLLASSLSLFLPRLLLLHALIMCILQIYNHIFNSICEGHKPEIVYLNLNKCFFVSVFVFAPYPVAFTDLPRCPFCQLNYFAAVFFLCCVVLFALAVIVYLL